MHKLHISIIFIITFMILVCVIYEKSLTKENGCNEMILKDDTVLNKTSTLYYKKDTQWGARKVPIFYICPEEVIESVHADASALYHNENIFISKETGILKDDPFAWSLAVHELSHHLQFLDGKIEKVYAGQLRECDLENEAYDVQRSYLDFVHYKWTIDEEDECK